MKELIEKQDAKHQIQGKVSGVYPDSRCQFFIGE
jgi:hypothetical protein